MRQCTSYCREVGNIVLASAPPYTFPFFTVSLTSLANIDNRRLLMYSSDHASVLTAICVMRQWAFEELQISSRVLPRSFLVSSHVPDSNLSLLPLASDTHCGAPCPISWTVSVRELVLICITVRLKLVQRLSVVKQSIIQVDNSTFFLFSPLVCSRNYHISSCYVQNRGCFLACLLWVCATRNHHDLAGWQHLPVSWVFGVVLSS